MRLLTDVISNLIFAAVAFYAYKESRLKGVWSILFLISLAFVTVYDIVDLLSPVESVTLQVLWFIPAFFVSVVVFPYLFRIFKRDILSWFIRMWNNR